MTIKTKICGLKTLRDIEIVNKYLPDYIGFVFANTKRFVTDEEAYKMKRALEPKILAVGVFVDEPIEHVLRLCEKNIIDVVQLHGNESRDYIENIKRETDKPVINAIKVQSKEQVLKEISDLADIHLFDTYKKGTLGGTGERFDLDILHEALKEKKLFNYFLAGGITPQNAKEILSKEVEFRKSVGNTSGFIGLDISTGVETLGVKDEDKIRKFLGKEL